MIFIFYIRNINIHLNISYDTASLKRTVERHEGIRYDLSFQYKQYHGVWRHVGRSLYSCTYSSQSIIQTNVPSNIIKWLWRWEVLGISRRQHGWHGKMGGMVSKKELLIREGYNNIFEDLRFLNFIIVCYNNWVPLSL